MKKTKILSPFILHKKNISKPSDLIVKDEKIKRIPNYLFLKPFTKIPNSNQELFTNFKKNYKKDIYTTPRYIEPTFDNIKAFNDKMSKIKSQIEINNIIADARNKSLLWTKKRSRKVDMNNKSSFNATLPKNLDLSLILQNPTNLKEFETLSTLNKKIILDENGNLKSSDLDWTMSNYKEAAFDDTRSHLFDLSKSNKSNLFQSPIFATENYNRSIHKITNNEIQVTKSEKDQKEIEIEDNSNNS